MRRAAEWETKGWFTTYEGAAENAQAWRRNSLSRIRTRVRKELEPKDSPRYSARDEVYRYIVETKHVGS